ncbi:30S ribosomal protein S16 [Candidatus Poribacteria bacterium]|nr:30S ribosomal protein S16 [Candidatus Poribacteria bacterium]MYK18353.1 30S ribosomal protein S16 [Candidatus Poribacteria bacterium]
MAVRIRLQRHGRKKRPFYRLVAADARAQRDGAFLERLGYYNPLTDPADVFIDEEKALKWLRRGAQPTDTAKRLLSKRGILMKFEYEKLGRPMPEAAGDAAVPETEDEQSAEAEAADAQPTDAETGSLLTEAAPDEATPESDEEA